MTCLTSEDTSQRGDSRDENVEIKIDELAELLSKMSKRRRKELEWESRRNRRIRDMLDGILRNKIFSGGRDCSVIDQTKTLEELKVMIETRESGESREDKEPKEAIWRAKRSDAVKTSVLLMIVKRSMMSWLGLGNLPTELVVRWMVVDNMTVRMPNPLCFQDPKKAMPSKTKIWSIRAQRSVSIQVSRANPD